MRIIKYEQILWQENLGIIKDIIVNDGVMIYPTDTLYGLGGNFFSLPAIEKIDALKRRSDMPYSVLVSGLNMLEGLVESVPPVFFELYQKILPGKFTFLFKVSKSIDRTLVKGSDKIGIRIRIPNVANILKLVEILNVPLISTSVNRSGEQPLNDPAAMAGKFQVPLQISAGGLPASKGSTILDITETPVKCIRKGDDFGRLKGIGIDII